MKAPAEGVLRIGGGNAYVANKTPEKAVNAAAATRAHSWGWSEGKNLPHLLRELKGHNALIANGMPDRADSNDCVMHFRKSLAVVHTSMTKACDDVPGSKVGHRRTFSMLAYEAPMLGKGAVVCHVAIHPNWVVGFDGAGAEVVQEYLRSLDVLATMLAFAKGMGWHIVVTGDFNTRRGQKKPYRTVYDVFKDAGLAVKTEGIDGVAYDRRLRLVGWEAPNPQRWGSDHDHWTIADFASRKRKTA